MKWGGAAVFAIIAALAIRSLVMPYELIGFAALPSVGVVQGSLYYCDYMVYFPRKEQFSFVGDINPYAPALWWRQRASALGTRFTVPLWMPALPFATMTAIAWRLEHRQLFRSKRGLCLKCGYPRSGLAPKSSCPECGSLGAGFSVK